VSTEPATQALSRELALLLRGGVVLAAALFALGLLAIAIDHEPFDPARFAHFVAPSGGSHWWPSMPHASDVLLHLGLLALLLLPIARLALAAVVFAKERDRLFSAISAIVLLLVLLSTALARVE
jgi:uncharacterized membrane protein